MTNLKDLEKVGRQAWLATIGTYAKGWELVSDQASKTFDDTNNYINGLIKDGEQIETDLKAKIQHSTQLDEKVAQLKVKLGLDTSYEDKLHVLSQKVEALTVEVEKLIAAKLKEAETAKQAVKPEVKAEAAKAETTEKPAVKKATRAAKPASAKPIATKTPAKAAATETKAEPAKKPTRGRPPKAAVKSPAN